MKVARIDQDDRNYACIKSCCSALLAPARARPQCTWRRMEGEEWKEKEKCSGGRGGAGQVWLKRTLVTASQEQVLELEAELGGHVHKHQRHQRPDAPARRLRLLQREPDQHRRHRLRTPRSPTARKRRTRTRTRTLTFYSACTTQTRAPGAARATRWSDATC